MICPKCGHESTGNFCSHCGALLRLRENLGTEVRSGDGRHPEKPLTGRNGLPDREEAPADADRPIGIRENIPASDSASADLTARRGRSRRREEPFSSLSASSSAEAEPLTETASARKAEAAVKKERNEKPRPAKSRAEKSRSGGGKSDKSDSRAAKKAELAEKKADKAEKKERRQKDERIARQFKEAGEREAQLNKRMERMDRERQEWLERRAGGEDPDGTYGGGNGQRLGEAAAKGAVGLIVLGSRLMQLCSCFLMGYMVWMMARSFWSHQEGLGLIASMVDERNYGLAFYVGFAGFTLFMGVIWCLWILSRKAAGGNVRLKKYDVGRGFIPFLLCAAAVAAAGAALSFLPQDTAAWEGAALGVQAALTAVNAHRERLLFCSILGAVLSLVRKILRV